MNVVEVKQNPKKPENAFVKLDDGQDCWCPSYEKASALVIGQPLPPGWEITPGDYGPRLFPPKDKNDKGSPRAAFANTREGLVYTQERSDRRTALMQAVALMGSDLTKNEAYDPVIREVFTKIAGEFYTWLRATATPPGGGANGGGQVPTPEPSPTQVPQPTKDSGEKPWGASAGSTAGTQGSLGEGTDLGACPHRELTVFKPDNETPLPRGFVRCVECGTVMKEGPK